MYTGPKLTNDDLVFGYDTGYGVANNTTSTRFYPGEPTTNMVSSVQHGSGQLLAVQSVTVSYVGEEDGWSKYSLNGSWTAGTYPYSMRVATAGPFSAGVKYSTQCKIKTNVPHKFTYFASNGLSYVNVALTHNGVNSSTFLEDEGCYLLKREGFAYSTTTSQPGYLWTRGNSETFSSSTDFVWIKDFMVEQKDHCSPWTATSRANTASLIDLKRTKDITVANVSFDSTGQPTFDGTDDHIALGASSQFNIARNVTIEAVVKKDSSGWNGIFGRSDGGSFIHYQLYNDTVNLYFYGPALACVTGNIITSTSKYYHIVATFDGSSAKIYVDGSNTTTATTSSTANVSAADNVSVGKVYSSSRHFDGEIPVLKVYNRTLTSNEILKNYNAYKNRFNI
jgi:hypothetical protein